jgi:uncharacterized membrane protein
MSSDQTEKLIQMSRRQLWFAMGFITILGTLAILRLASLQTKSEVAALWANLPIVIIIAVTAMKRAKKRVEGTMSPRQLDAIVNDELRQASQQRAYRNGFFAVLVAQPLLAIVVTSMEPAYPVGIMAVGSAIAGALTMFGSLLYYDR